METQKKDTGLVQSNKPPLQLCKIFKPTDLLSAIPMVRHLKNGNHTEVLTHLRLSVEKCAMALNISMSDFQVAVLCEDILDTYKYDSIEDVQECLKHGRRGEYGFGHNSRASLNMLVVREWMSLHLEKKAATREKMLSEEKTKSGGGRNLSALESPVVRDLVKGIVEHKVVQNQNKEKEFQSQRKKYFNSKKVTVSEKVA